MNFPLLQSNSKEKRFSTRWGAGELAGGKNQTTHPKQTNENTHTPPDPNKTLKEGFLHRRGLPVAHCDAGSKRLGQIGWGGAAPTPRYVAISDKRRPKLVKRAKKTSYIRVSRGYATKWLPT